MGSDLQQTAEKLLSPDDASVRAVIASAALDGLDGLEASMQVVKEGLQEFDSIIDILRRSGRVSSDPKKGDIDHIFNIARMAEAISSGHLGSLTATTKLNLRDVTALKDALLKIPASGAPYVEIANSYANIRKIASNIKPLSEDPQASTIALLAAGNVNGVEEDASELHNQYKQFYEAATQAVAMPFSTKIGAKAVAGEQLKVAAGLCGNINDILDSAEAVQGRYAGLATTDTRSALATMREAVQEISAYAGQSAGVAVSRISGKPPNYTGLQ